MAWYGEERKEEADYFTYLRPTISGFLANEYADVEDAEEYLKSWLCPVKWQETSKAMTGREPGPMALMQPVTVKYPPSKEKQLRGLSARRDRASRR